MNGLHELLGLDILRTDDGTVVAHAIGTFTSA